MPEKKKDKQDCKKEEEKPWIYSHSFSLICEEESKESKNSWKQGIKPTLFMNVWLCFPLKIGENSWAVFQRNLWFNYQTLLRSWHQHGSTTLAPRKIKEAFRIKWFDLPSPEFPSCCFLSQDTSISYTSKKSGLRMLGMSPMY